MTVLLAVIGMGCTMDEGKRFLYLIGTSYACQYQTENDPQGRLKGGECHTRKPSYEDYKSARREELDGKSTDGRQSNSESGRESREK
jgi:hypothetical protein